MICFLQNNHFFFPDPRQREKERIVDFKRVYPKKPFKKSCFESTFANCLRLFQVQNVLFENICATQAYPFVGRYQLSMELCKINQSNTKTTTKKKNFPLVLSLFNYFPFLPPPIISLSRWKQLKGWGGKITNVFSIVLFVNFDFCDNFFFPR